MSDTTLSSSTFVRSHDVEPTPPPSLVGGPLAWMRHRLFSSVLNTVLTVVGLYLLYLLLPPLIRFFVTDAVWTGTNREACLGDKAGFQVGACWAYVADRFSYFIYGSYPIAARWRVDVVFALGAIGIGWLLWLDAPRRDVGAFYFFILFPVIGFILLTGGNYDFSTFLLGRALGLADFGTSSNVLMTVLNWAASVLLLPFALIGKAIYGTVIGPAAFWVDVAASTAIACLVSLLIGRLFGASVKASVLPVLAIFAVWAFLLVLLEIDWGLTRAPTNLWGGILVTLVVALVGIVFSLPIGILLALGRRSRMPVVRLLSVIFIEFVRGVPLITVLFMANTMLPLFLPGSASPDRLLRALVGVAMFASAYMAEVIRGGLQAMPRGQYEGAMSLGLGYWQMMRLIILPQALRIVIPGIVNTFIGLFKDTTLVFIVGIFDFLKAIDASLVDPTWATPTTRYTGYAFAAVFYFICCYGMSRYSLAIERRMAAGQRR